MLKISHTNNILFALGVLAEINLNLVKISIFVSMATMEATWLLGMFQLLILEEDDDFLFNLCEVHTS